MEARQVEIVDGQRKDGSSGAVRRRDQVGERLRTAGDDTDQRPLGCQLEDRGAEDAGPTDDEDVHAR